MQRTKPFSADRLHLAEVRWLSISVKLRPPGGGERPLAHPERALITSPRHTFADLALAIDEAFGRWELGRSREFRFEDGSRVGEGADDSPRSDLVDDRRARLYRLREGERFAYLTDSGERWEHECLVMGWIDPDEVLLDRPTHPAVFQSVGRTVAAAAGSTTTAKS